MGNADDWTQSTPRKPKPPRDRSIGLRYGGRTKREPPNRVALFFTDFRTDRPPQPPRRALPSSFSPLLSRSGGRQWCGGDDHCRPPTLHKRRILTHRGPTDDIKMSLWCPEPGSSSLAGAHAAATAAPCIRYRAVCAVGMAEVDTLPSSSAF